MPLHIWRNVEMKPRLLISTSYRWRIVQSEDWQLLVSNLADSAIAKSQTRTRAVES